MKKDKKIHIKEPLWISLLKFIARPFLRLKWGYKVRGRYNAKKGENILVLSNHQTDLDPLLVRLSVNRYLYTVATDNIFSDPKTSKWLIRLGAIPKRKGMVDIKNAMMMNKIAEEGGSILLFPEGNRSYAEFQFYIADNFAKLLKNLKCTVILFNIHGGFGVLPRFGSKKKRKGPFYGKIKKILKYEEYENMSVEELNAIIKDNLNVIDANSKATYKGKYKAEYLERMYFVCPKCGNIECLKSEGNILKCDKCGLEVEYTERLNLKSNDPAFKFKKLNDWYEYQKEWVRNYNVKSGEVIFKDEGLILSTADPYINSKILAKGNLTLTDEKLSINDVCFNISDIEIASPVSGRNLCITINGNNYVIRGKERFNALKYVLMFNKLETKMKKEGTDKYYCI